MNHVEHSPSSERVMIAAFEGWSDAGAATTTVLQHLGELTDAETLHTIGADGFVDFQVHRPKVSFDAQGKRVLEEVEEPGTVSGKSNVIDLMAALKKSVGEGGAKTTPRKPPASKAADKEPAKKPAAKKPATRTRKSA